MKLPIFYNPDIKTVCIQLPCDLEYNYLEIHEVSRVARPRFRKNADNLIPINRSNLDIISPVSTRDIAINLLNAVNLYCVHDANHLFIKVLSNFYIVFYTASADGEMVASILDKLLFPITYNITLNLIYLSMTEIEQQNLLNIAFTLKNMPLVKTMLKIEL